VRKLLLTLLLLVSASAIAATSRVAIVIDDIGYRYTDHQVLEIPGDITYAVLPHTPYGKKLANIAHKNNHDVFLHIPMEAEHLTNLGPGALTSDMDEKAIRESLNKSFSEIPFAIGINNHMGSRLTKMYDPMVWTMSYLKDNQKLFLDSKTSAGSKASQAARDVGVPTRNRHVFLDNELTEAYIVNQFIELVNNAQRNEIAIAIAHPHPETVRVLKKMIPTLASHNVELVPLSELYPNKQQNTALLNAL